MSLLFTLKGERGPGQVLEADTTMVDMIYLYLKYEANYKID